jgi:hypothetical protein
MIFDGASVPQERRESMKIMSRALVLWLGASLAACGGGRHPSTPDDGSLTVRRGAVSVKSDAPDDDIIRTGVFDARAGRAMATMQWTRSGAKVAFNAGAGVVWLDAPAPDATLAAANALAYRLWLEAAGRPPGGLAPQEACDDWYEDPWADCDTYSDGTDVEPLDPPVWPFQPPWP